MLSVFPGTAPVAHAADFARLRVAIVHYWFVGRGGGERVVEALAGMFPQADLFALVADPTRLGPLGGRRLQTSFLDRLPGSRRIYRHLLPLAPMALEQFDLSGYDLVLSSESGPAKGVITSPGACHVCYCHSPMRYLWDMHAAYRRQMGRLTGAVFTMASHYLRMWDYAAAARVDQFVANSRFVAARIERIYRRPSTVIHPPVNIAEIAGFSEPGDHYLAAGRLVDYKRFDLAVEACTRLGRRLRVVGEGPEYRRLKRMAGPTVEFLGPIDDDSLAGEFAACRALLFPGEEDFGMVPVEAQSYGRPVVAYGSGGALETVRAALPGSPAVVASPTGVLFAEQTVEALMAAIERLERRAADFSPVAIRRHAMQFARVNFEARMRSLLTNALWPAPMPEPQPEFAPGVAARAAAASQASLLYS